MRLLHDAPGGTLAGRVSRAVAFLLIDACDHSQHLELLVNGIAKPFSKLRRGYSVELDGWMQITRAIPSMRD